MKDYHLLLVRQTMNMPQAFINAMLSLALYLITSENANKNTCPVYVMIKFS